MKFLEQALSFQKRLLRQSRIFTSIMLVSGVGLVAAAPFLSYEAATIQCYEAEDNVVVINDGETVIMKGELERKDKEINRFKQRLDAVERRMDCKGIIDDLEKDRAELLEELNDCEKSLNDCLSNNSALKEMQDKIDALSEENEKLKKALESCGTDLSEVDDLKAEITKLNKEIAVLQRRLNACLEQGAGNDNFKNEIDALNAKITAYIKRVQTLKNQVDECEGRVAKLEKLAADYKNRWELCNSSKRESSTSTKLQLAFSLSNGQEFRMNNNVFSNSVDFTNEGGVCTLKRNQKSIQAELVRRKGVYSFNSAQKKYILRLIDDSNGVVYLTINEQ